MPEFTRFLVNVPAGSIRPGHIPGVILLLLAWFYPAGQASAANINVPADYATISAAVAAASSGDVILVAPGTYNENVSVGVANLTIRSTGGAAVTTIQGSNVALGTIYIPNGINGVSIGGIGQGFTIVGYDGSGAVECAAVYLAGAHNNISIVGNIIVANGEHGLLTEYNAAINGIYISDNTFSGQTFIGAEPGGNGFSTQFDPGNNVPRQLVVMGGGPSVTNSLNVSFINNQVTGVAGGYNSTESVEQGNFLVTIDVIGATIAQNTFSGTTTRTAGSLRTRGQAASISCNTFNTAGLGANCQSIFFGSANPLTGATPSTLAGVATANAFPQGGAYLSPDNANSYIVFRSLAQATSAATLIGAGQAAVLASAVLNCPVTNTNTGRIFGSIGAAIADASTLNGHTIAVAAGVYNEDVNVNKDLTIQGAGLAVCTVSGPIGGNGATFQVASPGVVIEGFTITRDGNNTTDWNNSGLNTAGIAIQGQANDAEVKNCKITGNRTGIDINDSDGNNIHHNVITFNRTGLIFRNKTDNTAVTENEITDNWTIGVLFLDASSGTNVPVQSALNSTFNSNKISDNWYGQIQDRQGGGSLPAPGTTNMKNFECNWYGTTSPVKSNVNSAEPGYSAQIPVAYGGAATPPGGQPHILGVAADNLDYLLFLTSGTDNEPVTSGFQPAPLSCTGGCPGGGVVINANSNAIYCSIQDAINAASSGNRLKIATGTYSESVDAATGGKNIILAPGNSPGCVTLGGNLTLNGGDVLEMEIAGTTPCTQHDQFIVSGTVTLGGATLSLPAGMFIPSTGDAIKIIDGSSPVVGQFAQGSFVSDGTTTYYIDYAGGDGNDVVLTKCCDGLLDIGLFNYAAPTPVGNKLRVFVKPNNNVINGSYSSGTFTLRTLSSNAVTFTNLGSTYGYAQIGPKLTSGGYDYFFFNFESVFPVSWNKDTEYELLRLGYACTGNATFELINDAFALSNGGAFYQELGAQEAQGVFYQASATSPASVSALALSNSPVCQTMNIDLNSTVSNGTPAFSYLWAGPDSYTSALGDPAPFPALLTSGGTYSVTVTDNNGCSATANTAVAVSSSGACVKNVDLNTYYPTIGQAINAAETVNSHTLEVPAGTWSENITVSKALVIKGANFGIPCDGSRTAESILSGGAGTAVTIGSDGVTIDGFQIEGSTGISSAGYTKSVLKNNRINALAVGINSALLTTSASAGYTIQDNCVDLAAQVYETFAFAANPTLAATQTAGAWYTDRYAPAGFVAASLGGNSRLKHSISAADCEGCRPGAFSAAFYNTQGRKYDITGATAMSISLYVPAAWATTNRRMAGFWGTTVDGGNAIARYPIIEFTSDGNNPRFRVYDNGVWVDLGLPAGFAYDQWYTLNIAIVGTEIHCNVGNLTAVISGGGSVSIANVILQGHNTVTPGVTYDIYWDNLNTYGSPVATANSPTVGIALTAAGGTQAVVVQDNNVSDAFYGYVLSGVTTAPRTVVKGGSYANLMQGVGVFNTLDGLNYTPSTVGVADLSLSSFGGNYPTLPAANFHAGIYAFTGGSNTAAVVDIQADNVTVSNTGKTSQASAGLYFADFSTGAGNRLNAVVTACTVSNNLNRGIQVRGANATAAVNTSTISGNGSDPYGLGGNDGYGIYAGVGAAVTLNNNFIVNPPAQAGSYPVTAMFIGVAPAASITAYENHISRNGNGTLTGNSYAISQFTATCNWWGNGLIDAVDALVDGNVTFIPYLNVGTDNSASAGFQPVPGACVNPKRWYVNDNALAGDVYTLAVGNDLNQGTKRRPFQTIGKAIATVVTGDTIFVDAGSYNEQAVVPATKDNLLFMGAGLPTVVDFTGTVSGKPTLFDIAGDGVIIDGFQFNTDVTRLSSAMIFSDPAIDNVTVRNNRINPYQSVADSYYGSFGNRNAISINYGGSINYRVATGGVNSIVVDNNTVTATVNGTILGDGPGDIGFRAAVSVDEGAGTYTRNTFKTVSHDVLIRFNSNGAVVIGGSVANANTFQGGGVQYSDPNSGGGAVTISHNAFDGAVTASVLRLQNNYYNAAVSVANNTFSNLRWGISLENFPAATIANNVFTPLAGYTAFRHITVNTKSLSGNSASISQVPIDGVFTGNTFNSLTPVAGGTALAFYNHDSDNAVLGTFTVGTAGSPNVFAKDFAFAVYLGDQTGSTLPAPPAFPEYNLGGSSGTTMACWTRDIDIQNNTFDIGSGAQLPSAMNNAQRLALEAILWHLPDNGCLGELIYFTPVEVFAKVFLQGPYDPSGGLMSDALRAASLLPVGEPYTAINISNAGSFPEVNDFVTETVNPSVFTVTGSNAIVDWVWLELRDKTNSSTVLGTRSALVQRDGDIVDLDGTSAVLFPDNFAGEYYLMVRHRNHLGAMTAAPVDFSGAPFVDFSVAAQATFGTTSTSARRLVKTGVYGLWAGNTIPKSSGGYQILYNGSQNDRNAILNVVGPSTPLNIVSNVYMLEDVNLNGNVQYSGSGNDRAIILNNVGPATPLNVITQEPNN